MTSMDYTAPIAPAAREARRLRTAMRKHGGVIVMVCSPAELESIRAELTPRELKRVRLLTSWPYTTAALASEKLAAA